MSDAYIERIMTEIGELSLRQLEALQKQIGKEIARRSVSAQESQ